MSRGIRFSSKSKKRLALVGVLAAALVSAIGAIAYWTTTGTGSATASTATLNAPTGVSGQASGSTVSVSWTAASGGVTPQGYYVTRNNGSADSAACGSSASSLITSTNCSDTTVPSGSYTYRVVAVYRSWTAVSAPSSSVTVAALDHFAVTATSPQTAGGSFSLTVVAKDAANATIPTYNGTVHFVSSDGQAVLPGDYTFTTGTGNDNGTHAFSVTLKTAGSQSLSVNDTVQTGATGSVNITVNAASAARVVFAQQPSSSTGGVAFPQQPKVTVRDGFGNTVTTDTSTVALSITSGTPASGGPGTLSGCSQTEAAGVITFSGCKIDTIGSGYTLHATDGSLTTDDSSAFNITLGPAAKLAFTQQPGNGTGGSALSTQPKVSIQDAGGNTRSADTTSVTVAIGGNAGPGGVLSGTATVNAVAGVATFSGLSIDKIGSGYTLSAAAGALAGDISSPFNITLGPAARVKFTQQPSSSTGGVAFPQQPRVSIQDAGGNTRSADTTAVTVAIGGNAGPGGVLSGTATVNAVAGVATFSGLSIDKIGSGYTLSAAAGALAGDISSPFNITLGPAAKVKFTQQPSSSTGGVAFPQQPRVSIQDAGGNTRTADTTAVTVAIGTNAGPGGVLSGTATVNAVAGVATFSGLSIDKIGTGYTLTASASGLTGATSSTFNITLGPAAKLAFTQQPGNGTGGSALSTQPKVSIQDAGGNTRSADTTAVTVAIGTNAGPGGVLSGAATVNAVAGVATFSGLSIDKIGSGYTLSAAAGALTGDTSSPFTITLGPAAKLAFTQQPGNGTGGSALSTQPKVAVQDAGGNTETGDNATTVTVAIGNNAGPGGTLSGTKTVTVAAGVATFSGLSIDKIGNNYSLSATSSPANGTATSNQFNITAGAAAKLNVAASGGTITAGRVVNLTVTAVDAGGNTATSFTGSQNITFTGANTVGPNVPTVTSSGGTATAFGTATALTFVNGVSSVSSSTNGVATLYRAEVASITATASGVIPNTAAAVTVNVGAPAKLAWTSITAPATGVPTNCYFTCTYPGFANNNTFTAKVSITDSAGNIVSGIGSATTLSVAATVQSTGGAFTAPTAGANPQSLTIPAAGTATSSASFSYKTGTSSWTTDGLIARVTAGTSRTDATAALSKN